MENQNIVKKLVSKFKLLTLIVIYFSFSMLVNLQEVSASPCPWVSGWTVHNNATNPYSLQYVCEDCDLLGGYIHNWDIYDQGKYVFNYNVIDKGIVTSGIPFLVTPEYLGTTDRNNSSTSDIEWTQNQGFTKTAGIEMELFKGLTGNVSVSSNWDSGTGKTTPVPWGPATLADKSYFYADINVHLWDMEGRYYTEWYNDGVLDHMDVITGIEHIYKWERGVSLPAREVPVPEPTTFVLLSSGVAVLVGFGKKKLLKKE